MSASIDIVSAPKRSKEPKANSTTAVPREPREPREPKKPSSIHYTYAYADEHSIGHDAMRDWNIGAEHGLVGSNKAPGAGKENTWVVIKTTTGKYGLGFTGALTSRQTRQPWEEAGGKQWKYVYACTHHVWIGDLDEFCMKYGFDPKMFTQSLQFGHPGPTWISEFDRAALVVRGALENKKPADAE
jgi:hypothetical protein